MSNTSLIDELRRVVLQANARLRRGEEFSPAARATLREAKRLLVEQDHGEGVAAASKCRSSGAQRTLHRPGALLAAYEGWTVYCDDHGTLVTTATRRDGETAMACVDWCPACRARAEVQP